MELIDYLYKPVLNEKMLNIYQENEIEYELVCLYYDFTLSLFFTVIDTYLGDDVMTTKYQEEHFNWCWNKTVNIFKLENFDFNSEELKNFLFEFINEMFYKQQDKSDEKLLDIIKQLSKMLKYETPKSLLELDTFLSFYKIYNNAFKYIKK